MTNTPCGTVLNKGNNEYKTIALRVFPVLFFGLTSILFIKIVNFTICSLFL